MRARYYQTSEIVKALLFDGTNEEQIIEFLKEEEFEIKEQMKMESVWWLKGCRKGIEAGAIIHVNDFVINNKGSLQTMNITQFKRHFKEVY